MLILILFINKDIIMKKEFPHNNYSPLYRKIRRILTNLFRPIKVDSKNPLLKVHPISYIMLFSFSISGIMLENKIQYSWLPFLIGFTITSLSMLYFNFLPLSWDEMYEYEKVTYRIMNQLPEDWNPE